MLSYSLAFRSKQAPSRFWASWTRHRWNRRPLGRRRSLSTSDHGGGWHWSHQRAEETQSNKQVRFIHLKTHSEISSKLYDITKKLRNTFFNPLLLTATVVMPCNFYYYASSLYLKKKKSSKGCLFMFGCLFSATRFCEKWRDLMMSQKITWDFDPKCANTFWYNYADQLILPGNCEIINVWFSFSFSWYQQQFI